MPLAITPGEPAGIGPDLCVMLAQQDRHEHWIAIGDPQLLTSRAEALGLPLTVCEPQAWMRPALASRSRQPAITVSARSAA